MRSGQLPAHSQAVYPPEFKFCDDSGKQLSLPLPAHELLPWVPPFGVLSIAARSRSTAHGLRQTASSLLLNERSSRRADSDPDAEKVLPPNGDYEFFSLPAATLSPALIALDAVKGMMFAWLPSSKKWAIIEQANHGDLAASGIARHCWRCEVSTEGLHSSLYLPTEEGLACVTPDAIGLRFQVNYLGNAPAVGAPIHFGEQVWAPVCVPGGQLTFVGASPNGESTQSIACIASLPSDWSSQPFHLPLADSRMALWPHVAGQLLLRKLNNGTLEAKFIRWPEGLSPVFDFGCAYLARDGGLWQACFDAQHDCYAYVQLGVDRPEIHRATAPRLCTGIYNFRFATRHKTAPWHEPEHGDDSAADAVVLPLLESMKNASVIGLKLATTQGLSQVLKSKDRFRVELVLEDDNTQTAFGTFSVDEPWRTRVFQHDGQLWAYHPNMNRMIGWNLQK